MAHQVLPMVELEQQILVVVAEALDKLPVVQKVAQVDLA
jgi:hypothetical protein